MAARAVSGSSMPSTCVGVSPRARAAARTAASSRVLESQIPSGQFSRGAPTKWTTTGFSMAAARRMMVSATAAAGGLETRTITSVASSPARASRPWSMVMPPTASERSRPPVPMAWLIPAPFLAMQQAISWMPVPEAPTMPTLPRGTMFAKARGAPLMMAVPQSGPMTRSPRSRAFSLRRTSSSRATLSEKSMTCRPASRALFASRAAWAPGMDTRRRLASGATFTAASRETGS